jgi:hypothetical protein
MFEFSTWRRRKVQTKKRKFVSDGTSYTWVCRCDCKCACAYSSVSVSMYLYVSGVDTQSETQRGRITSGWEDVLKKARSWPLAAKV